MYVYINIVCLLIAFMHNSSNQPASFLHTLRACHASRPPLPRTVVRPPCTNKPPPRFCPTAVIVSQQAYFLCALFFQTLPALLTLPMSFRTVMMDSTKQGERTYICVHVKNTVRFNTASVMYKLHLTLLQKPSTVLSSGSTKSWCRWCV